MPRINPRSSRRLSWHQSQLPEHPIDPIASRYLIRQYGWFENPRQGLVFGQSTIDPILLESVPASRSPAGAASHGYDQSLSRIFAYSQRTQSGFGEEHSESHEALTMDELEKRHCGGGQGIRSYDGVADPFARTDQSADYWSRWNLSGQLMPSLEPPRGDHSPSSWRCHSVHESMPTLSAAFLGLPRSFRH